MVKLFSTDHLKHKREIDLCLCYIQSNAPLVIGIGAKNTIKSLLKDLNISGMGEHKYVSHDKIPFKANSFDSLISLNTLDYCSDWQKDLQHWQSLLQSNGRMIFNLLSSEYKNLFSAYMDEDNTTAEPHNYISLNTLISFANENNLKIIDIIPYGEVYNKNSQWIIRSGSNLTEWRRLLSRADYDQTFFEFLNFLDATLFSKLSSATAKYSMIILEKSATVINNDHWKDKQQEIDTIFSSMVSIDKISPFLEDNPNLWQNHLSSYLENPYALVLIFKLWEVVNFNTALLDMQSFLIPKHWSIIDHWVQQHSKDNICLDFVENWHHLPLFSQSLSFHNVSLGAGLEYELISETLTLSGAFDKEIQ